MTIDHLSGAIPQGRQLNTFNNDSFLGNLALCGVPLRKKCRDDELPTRKVADDVDDNWVDWKIILIGYGGGLACGLSTVFILYCFYNIKAKTICDIYGKNSA